MASQVPKILRVSAYAVQQQVRGLQTGEVRGLQSLQPAESLQETETVNCHLGDSEKMGERVADTDTTGGFVWKEGVGYQYQSIRTKVYYY